MTTPIQKIGLGIDALERAKNAPGKALLSALAAAPANITALSEIHTKVTKARDRLQKIRTVTVEAVREHREKVTSEYADFGMTANDSGQGRIDTLGVTRRKKMIEASVSTFQKEANAATAEERTKMLAEMREAKATLNLVRDVWASPVGVLMRDTLGSEKRSIYSRNLEFSGPAELNQAMSEAVRTSDKELAAACCVRIDSMGKEPRKLLKFSKSDVAEILAGDEWSKAIEAIGLADFAIAQSELADKEIRGIKVSPDEKIRVGQRLLELEAQTGKKFDNNGHSLNEDGTREGEPVQYTGTVSISESNRLWFTRKGLDDKGGLANA